MKLPGHAPPWEGAAANRTREHRPKRKAPSGEASPQSQRLGLRYVIASLSCSLIRNFTPLPLSVLVLERFPEYRLCKTHPPSTPHRRRSQSLVLIREPGQGCPRAAGTSCLSSAQSLAGPSLPSSERFCLHRQTLLQTQFNHQPTTSTEQLQHKHVTTCICKLINNENNVAALRPHRLALLRREGPLSPSPPLSLGSSFSLQLPLVRHPLPSNTEALGPGDSRGLTDLPRGQRFPVTDPSSHLRDQCNRVLQTPPRGPQNPAGNSQQRTSRDSHSRLTNCFTSSLST